MRCKDCGLERKLTESERDELIFNYRVLYDIIDDYRPLINTDDLDAIDSFRIKKEEDNHER